MTMLFKLVYIVTLVQPQLHIVPIAEELTEEMCIEQIAYLKNGYTIDKVGTTPVQGGYLCIPQRMTGF